MAATQLQTTAAPQESPQEAPFATKGASPAELLRLDNQLCFPLYACSKEVVRSYQPLLGPLGLTYTVAPRMRGVD